MVVVVLQVGALWCLLRIAAAGFLTETCRWLLPSSADGFLPSSASCSPGGV